MGISHSALEPEPSGLGHVDSNELLKPILKCSPPSCCCTLPLKSLCLGLYQEFLSQPSHKEEKVNTELSKESTIHSSSRTPVIFLPQSHLLESARVLWTAEEEEQRFMFILESPSSWLVCSSVQSTLPNQIPLFPHPNPRTTYSAADSSHKRLVGVSNATGTLGR